MTWLFVGFLVGLLTHRGYLRFIGWRRMRRFEKDCYWLAANIAKAQMRELHDAAHRNCDGNRCIHDRVET